jgi:type IV pilus assembly protein PilM
MVFGINKKTNLVGLDIGSRAIKLAEISESKKGERTLQRFGIIDIPPGLIEEGLIKNPAGVAQSIRELFTTSNVREQNVAISIGGFSVIIKKIDLPVMEEKQLQETIHVEAEQYIPFDIHDVNIDFQILGENRNNANQMSVLLVAAKKEIVNDYIDLIQSAGLNPCIIDIDAFALQNLFELAYGPKEENLALIEIGSSKTSMNILKENRSVFMRDVSLGCGQIINQIAARGECSFEDAERILLSGGSGKITESDRMEIISAVVGGWCTEIRRAFEYFYLNHPDDQIEKIFLCGGGANIKEFRNLLASETSIEVETVDPFKNIEIGSGRFDSKFLELKAPQAAICMGLAARRINDK